MSPKMQHASRVAKTQEPTVGNELLGGAAASIFAWPKPLPTSPWWLLVEVNRNEAGVDASRYPHESHVDRS